MSGFPSSSHSTSSLPVHVIAPAGGVLPIRLSEIWEYRELVYFLVWREIKIRSKQTALGVAWAVSFDVIERLSPGSFRGLATPQWSDFLSAWGR